MRSDLSGVIRKSSKQSSEVLVNHVAFAGYGEKDSKDVDEEQAESEALRSIHQARVLAGKLRGNHICADEQS